MNTLGQFTMDLNVESIVCEWNKIMTTAAATTTDNYKYMSGMEQKEIKWNKKQT